LWAIQVSSSVMPNNRQSYEKKTTRGVDCDKFRLLGSCDSLITSTIAVLCVGDSERRSIRVIDSEYIMMTIFAFFLC